MFYKIRKAWLNLIEKELASFLVHSFLDAIKFHFSQSQLVYIDH